MTASDADRARALALLKQWGWNATGFQVLERGFRMFFDGDDACVAYVDTGRAWVVAGAPIAPRERIAAVARSFLDAAHAAGRRACFFAVEQRFLDATSLPSLFVGEQASWDPQLWEAALAKRRSVREQLRRARAKGVRVRLVATSEMADETSRCRRDVEGLVRRWLGTRGMAAMGFLVDIQPFEFAHERRYFVAERGDELVGFLCAVPVFARGGWLFEDLLRDPHTPNGTTELIIDAAMRAVASEGSAYVTLGLAPLAGDVPTWLGRVREWTSALYDFDGIRSFKAKLAPHAWDPIFLAYPPDTSPNVALYDVLTAFAGGTFVGFGLRTLLRGPAIVVRALAVLLVPWTIVIATAAPRWFPSVGVQRAWVAFDVVVAVGLLALSIRWRARLAIVLAASITADAMLTTLEAATYNASRAHSTIAWLVMAIACAGPALGAVTLWGALRRRGNAALANARVPAE